MPESSPNVTPECAPGSQVAEGAVAGRERVEDRIARLRASEYKEWQRIEDLGPSEQEMADLVEQPPPEMFNEDWRQR